MEFSVYLFGKARVERLKLLPNAFEELLHSCRRKE
jgi:hypothetical protein